MVGRECGDVDGGLRGGEQGGRGGGAGSESGVRCERGGVKI